MAFLASVVKVMIASPGDVEEERQIAREVLHEWNCVHAEQMALVLLPVGWETHAMPEMGDRPQAIINKQILADCDILVGIFWTRLGTPTGKAASGTAEEIEEHLAAGKHAMLYFSAKAISPDRVDHHQHAALKELKAAYFDRGLVHTYNTNEDFRQHLYRHMMQTMNRVKFVGADAGIDSEEVNKSPVQADLPALSETARALLLEAIADKDGTLLCSTDSEGYSIQTNEKTFPEDQKPRTVARWQGAIRELEMHGLIQDQGYMSPFYSSYSVTDEGYRVGDVLGTDGSASTASPP